MQNIHNRSSSVIFHSLTLMIGLTTGITKIDGFHLRDVSHEIVVYQVPSFETGLIVLKWKNIKRETSR